MMGYAAKIVRDSISPDGVRLTTFEATFPRFILAEVNTHKMISKSSASSRAIPVKKRIDMILADPFVPEQFGKNRPGMQAGDPLDGEVALKSRDCWLQAMEESLVQASKLAEFEVHKQIANRLLEPFAWHTALLTATEWQNFFNLRCHKDAQPEFQTIARMMRGAYEGSLPSAVNYGEWHLPYVNPGEEFDALALGGPDGLVDDETVALVSAARCARLSYLTQDGVRDQKKDLALATDRLLPSGHMSPFEHVARPAGYDDRRGMRFDYGYEDPAVGWSGNFRGWVQLRKTIPNEAVFRG